MHPSFAKERARHKKKRLVQSPNSYFMDVKCVGKDCCRHLFFFFLSLYADAITSYFKSNAYLFFVFFLYI